MLEATGKLNFGLLFTQLEAMANRPRTVSTPCSKEDPLELHTDTLLDRHSFEGSRQKWNAAGAPFQGKQRPNVIGWGQPAPVNRQLFSTITRKVHPSRDFPRLPSARELR